MFEHSWLSISASGPAVNGPWQTAKTMSDERPSYDAGQIEAARQAAWAEGGAFETPVPAGGQPAVYVKPSSPFTSGNLHMGHVRDYSIGDAYARFRRARGDAVLFGFGFDAFGLPAEMAAIERGVRPADWVERCGERMLEQMKRLGFSFDYERAFYSSDEAQYRWSQWLFVTLLEAGLIYRDDATVDWCDTCQTTLAALQVEDGRCWRCHNPVRLIRRPTWFLRVTPYLEENDRNLERLAHWDELSLKTQRYILGRTDGVELDLEGGDGEALTAFTPHADAVAAARFVLLSPRHPAIERWVSEPGVVEQLEELRSGGWERSARDAAAVPLVDTGMSVVAPGGAELPVFVSPIVDARYGPTAALGIPSVDEADEAIAARMPRASAAPPAQVEARIDGVRPAKRYRAFDFSISRQRYWGTPIPVVHCEQCGAVPVPVEELPVRLPRDVEPTGEGNPLAERPDFVEAPCPRCGGPAKRETDTLDCHFDALWLWVPAAVPPEARDDGDVHPPRSAALAARRAARRRQRQRRLRLRPARRDQGAARHRPLLLPRGRRAIRRLPLPRDGDRRRAQDEQAPRQRRRPRRAGRRAGGRHGAAGDPLRGRPGQGAELERRRPALRLPLPQQPLGLRARPPRDRRSRRQTTPRPPPTPPSSASGWANGATTASSGSPPTSRSCRCTRRCAT